MPTPVLEFVFVIFIKSNSILNNISKFSTFDLNQDFVPPWQIDHLGLQMKIMFLYHFKILILCFCSYDGLCLLASPSVSPSVRPFRPVRGIRTSGPRWKLFMVHMSPIWGPFTYDLSNYFWIFGHLLSFPSWKLIRIRFSFLAAHFGHPM